VHNPWPLALMPGSIRSASQLLQRPWVSQALAKHPEQIEPSGQRLIATTMRPVGGVLPGSEALPRRGRSQRAQFEGVGVMDVVAAGSSQ
jgi:hypothetical protein